VLFGGCVLPVDVTAEDGGEDGRDLDVVAAELTQCVLNSSIDAAFRVRG
jgi:hypothetical protein